jgi:membrane protease YdiL (CAAX protease family)
VLGALAVAVPQPPRLRNVSLPGPVVQTLASVGAGLNEEIIFRLGAMTLFAWAGSKLTRGDAPGPAVFWTANVLAALVFGAAHLPQAASIVGLSAAAVAFVLAGNGIVGVACGWLYWRKGLVTAMVAHATANLVLRLVLAPLGRGLGLS